MGWSRPTTGRSESVTRSGLAQILHQGPVELSAVEV